MLADKRVRARVNRAFRAKALPVRACAGCCSVKHLSAFNAKRTSPDGASNQCRECDNADKRQWNADRREHRAEYRRTTADEANEYRKQWRAENRIKDRGYSAKRRALKLDSAVESFTDADLLDYWDSIGAYGCIACDGAFEHVDHVMPLALGGAHIIENLLPLCAHCNTSKNAKDPWRWAAENGWI